jgi:CrcB protein
MIHYFIVFVGGGLGAASRLAVSEHMARHLGTGFPWGTLAVNLMGALTIGVLIEFAALKWSMPDTWRYFLITGFLGGFTTFSAFSLETTSMIMRGDWGMAAGYTAISVIGTVALVLLATYTLRHAL